MIPCECGAPATCAVQEYRDGRALVRRPSCPECADGLDVAVSADDFAAVAASSACWCHPGELPRIPWCPAHGMTCETCAGTGEVPADPDDRCRTPTLDPFVVMDRLETRMIACHSCGGCGRIPIR